MATTRNGIRTSEEVAKHMELVAEEMGKITELADKLPKAYGSCKCPCHTTPRVMHCAPCCSPDIKSIINIPDA